MKNSIITGKSGQNYDSCQELAKKIRIDCVRMTNSGRSGHVGSMLSMADIVAVLYDRILDVDPLNPGKPDRDRFILSKGHAGAAVYAALAENGFIPLEWLGTYYKDCGKLSGHISHHISGVEFSTGSLGHGLPVAVGMSLAAKVTDMAHRVFCLMSDGDCNEGSTWEAIMFAAQQKLDNLIAIVDYNRVQALGYSEDIIDLEPLEEKLRNFNWSVCTINGHDCFQIDSALRSCPLNTGKPTMILAKTIKCKGIPHMENTIESHYRYVSDDDLENVLSGIGGAI